MVFHLPALDRAGQPLQEGSEFWSSEGERESHQESEGGQSEPHPGVLHCVHHAQLQCSRAAGGGGALCDSRWGDCTQTQWQAL